MIKHKTEKHEELVASLQETSLYATHFQECKDFQEYKELAALPTRSIHEAERMIEILENAMLQGNDELVEAINNFEDLILQVADTNTQHESSSCVEYQTVIIDFLKAQKPPARLIYLNLRLLDHYNILRQDSGALQDYKTLRITEEPDHGTVYAEIDVKPLKQKLETLQCQVQRELRATNLAMAEFEFMKFSQDLTGRNFGFESVPLSVLDFLKAQKPPTQGANIIVDMPGLGEPIDDYTIVRQGSEALQGNYRTITVIGKMSHGKSCLVRALTERNTLLKHEVETLHQTQRELTLWQHQFQREKLELPVLIYFTGHGAREDLFDLSYGRATNPAMTEFEFMKFSQDLTGRNFRFESVPLSVEDFHTFESISCRDKIVKAIRNNRFIRWNNIEMITAQIHRVLQKAVSRRLQLKIAQCISWEKRATEFLKLGLRDFLGERTSCYQMVFQVSCKNVLTSKEQWFQATSLKSFDTDLKLIMERLKSSKNSTDMRGQHPLLSCLPDDTQADASSIEDRKHLWAANLGSFQKYCTLKITGDVDMLSSSVDSCNVQTVTAESSNKLFEEYRSLAFLESRKLEDSERMLTILEEAMNNGDDELVNQINTLEDELSKNTALTAEEEYQCKPHRRKVQTFLSKHMKQSTAQDSSAISLMDLLGIEDHVFYRINIQKLGQLIDSSANQGHRCSSDILFPQRLSIQTLPHVYVAKVIQKSQWRCRSILISSIVTARDDRKKESIIPGASSSFYRQEMEDIKMKFSASLEDVCNQITFMLQRAPRKVCMKLLLSRKEELQSKLDKIFEEFMEFLDSQYVEYKNSNISKELMRYYNQEFTRLYGDLVIAFTKVMYVGSIEFRDSLPDTKPTCLRLSFPPTEIEIPIMNDPDEYETSRWEEISQIFRKLQNLMSDSKPPSNLVNIKQAVRSNHSPDHL